MNTRRIIAGIVLVDFAALNGYALYTEGLGGFVTWVTTLSPWGMVVFADLVIALLMVMYWMWRDAKTTDRNPAFYTLLTLALGSIGTLLYVVAGNTHEEPEDIIANPPEPARAA